MRRSAAFAGVLLLPLASIVVAEPPAPTPAPLVLDDFGSDPLDRWRARGLSFSEESAPPGTDPAGACLAIGSKGRGGSLERAVKAADWRGFDAVVLRAAVEADAPQPFRLLAIGGTPSRTLLHRFRLEPGPSRMVVLPLSAFREDGSDRVGSFASVDRVRIAWDEGAGTVRLDDLRLRPGARGASSWLPTREERLALAFPAGGGRVVEGERFAVYTDVAALDEAAARRLLARLEEGARVLAERFGISGPLEDRVPLHVFSSRADHQAFVARLGERYGVKIPPPSADGFTVLGVPSSTWDPKQGWDRPVYVHESVHGLLVRLLGLASNGSWVQEGIASAVQVRVHPRSGEAFDWGKAFEKARAGEKGPFRPLLELLAERRHETRVYPQLASVCEFLADRAGKDAQRLWRAVADDEKPLPAGGFEAAARALGTTPEDLAKAWLAAGTRPGAAPAAPAK